MSTLLTLPSEPVVVPAWQVAPLSTQWEHQLHHVGHICIISHIHAELIVAVYADGVRVDPRLWEVVIPDYFEVVEEVPPVPLLKQYALPSVRLASNTIPSQLRNDFVALCDYAREYTTGLGQPRRRRVAYSA